MRIKSIYLKDFRGFKELDVSFDENLSVLIGLNGSGKSSILDLIAKFLNAYIDDTSVKKKESFFIPEEVIRIIDNDVFVEAETMHSEIILSMSDKVEVKIMFEADKKGKILRWDWDIQNLYYEREKLSQNKKQNISIIVYYLSNRMLLDKIIQPSQNFSFTQQYCYENAIVQSFTTFNDFIDWFAKEQIAENELKLEKQNFNITNPNLEVIRNAVKSFFSILKNTDFTDLRIKTSSDSDVLDFNSPKKSHLIISKNGQKLKIEQLSDGEKMLLMLICDISRRLAIANPSLANPLKGNGIILVDEIELHLHPQWQREILPSLLKIFPNCQFIVTTHSPQVISKITKEHVLIIEEGNIVKETPNTFGRDINTILYELFNTQERPKEIQDDINKCFRLIDDGQINDATALLNKLEAQLGERDVEVIRAKTLLNFLS